VPDPIEALLPTTNTDDYVHAIKIDLNISETDTLRDTLIDIKYYPNRNLMDVKVKPKPFEFEDLDTVNITEEIIEETSFTEKLGYAFIGFVVISIIWIIIKRFT